MKKRLDVVLLAVLWSLIWVGMAPAAEVLRVTTWGGSYQKSYDVTVGDFEKENKCKVEWVVGSSADFMVKARMAQADVVTTDLTNAIMGETEGLWAKLDESKIPNMKHLYENAKHSPYTVFANVGDYALVYNSKMVKKAPTSWNALWDPAFKNRVAIYYFGSTGCTSLMILQAVQRGGSVDRIDPGLQRMVQLAKSGNLIGMVIALLAVYLNKRKLYGISSFLFILTITLLGVIQVLLFGLNSGFMYYFFNMSVLIVYTKWPKKLKLIEYRYWATLE